MPRHYCISTLTKGYQNAISSLSDKALLDQMNNWDEFKMPVTQLKPEWRKWVRLSRAEAQKRDLET